MFGRLNIHPIISFPFWQGAPTSDANNNPMDNLRELANLVMACLLDEP